MREPLYFRSFDLIEVVVPINEELATDEKGQPATWPSLPIVLVKGHLSNGMTALGEAGRGMTREDVKAVLAQLAGRDLWQTLPETHWSRAEIPNGLPPLFPEGGWVRLGPDGFALVECLIFDALGRVLGVPIHFFWGGMRAARVSADFWCYRPAPKEARKLARRAVEAGFRGLKMKAGLNETIIDTALAMREEVGRAFRITIDPMCAWRSFAESSFIFAALARHDGYWQIEDPFSHAALDCWRQARLRYGLPLIWHARTMELGRIGLQSGVADGFNLPGSGSDFVFAARAAEFLGLSCWHGTSIELGVKQHFQLHATAAVGNATLGNDFCSELVRRETLITPRMEIRDGYAVVPRRPGLGVDLDEAAVERYIQARETLNLE